MKVFGVDIEFDAESVDKKIENAIKNHIKGYVCSIEGNILAISSLDNEYSKIINKSLVNICDGSSIALMASLIKLKRLKTYIGADLFIKYIKNKTYRYYFLGNTQEVLDGLKKELKRYNCNISDMMFQELPFMSVNDFDYKDIAEKINQDKPDIIWVSLGAPKQEIFMSKLLPYINSGVMFGFGAIFDFYAGARNIKRAPRIMLKMRLEWLYRVSKEPVRVGGRALKYIKLMPLIITKEILKK